MYTGIVQAVRPLLDVTTYRATTSSRSTSPRNCSTN